MHAVVLMTQSMRMPCSCGDRQAKQNPVQCSMALLYNKLQAVLVCVCRDLVLEEREEKRVSEIIQKTMEQRGSFDRKFFYAVSRYKYLLNTPFPHVLCSTEMGFEALSCNNTG